MSNIRAYAVNENYFDVIDSEEKAYILGLLYSDGWVTGGPTYRVGFSSTDIELPQMLCACLDCSYPIKPHKKKEEHHSQGYEVSFGSKHMAGVLHFLGRTPLKSEAKYPVIPITLNRHFIRGVFDGDGSVSLTSRGYVRYTLVAPLKVLSTVVALIGGVIHKHGTTFRIERKGTNVSKNFYEYLYRDATLYLKRKEEIMRKSLR